MPLFKVDIEKKLGTEFWTNVYYVETADLTDAEGPASAILDAERAVHPTTVTFTKMRISSVAPGDDIYMTLVYNLPGLVVAPGTMLPLFNVVRVDLQASVGRPSRKYLRGVVYEPWLDFNDLHNDLKVLMQTAYCDALEAIPELRDVDGQNIVGCAPSPQIGMRQLRRGSKRRTQPIIP